MTSVTPIAIGALTLLLLDAIWILTFMKAKYEVMIAKIQGSPMKPKLGVAALAYVCMLIGWVVFVLPRVRSTHALGDSLWFGGVFGVCAYGIYDATAGALFDEWDMPLALIDVVWGGTVYAVATFASTLAR